MILELHKDFILNFFEISCESKSDMANLLSKGL